jgi:hypothetical protein
MDEVTRLNSSNNSFEGNIDSSIKLLSSALAYSAQTINLDNICFVVQLVHRQVTQDHSSRYRDIKLQEWVDEIDDLSRFRNSMRTVQSMFVDSMMLECRKVERVTNRDMEERGYEQIAILQHLNCHRI